MLADASFVVLVFQKVTCVIVVDEKQTHSMFILILANFLICAVLTNIFYEKKTHSTFILILANFLICAVLTTIFYEKKGLTYASFVVLIFRGGDFRTDQKTWLVRFPNDKN